MKYLITLLFVLVVGIGIWYFFLRQQKNADQTVAITYSTVVTKLQALDELTTAEMTIQKIVKGKKQLADLLPGSNWDNAVSSFLFEDNLLMTVEAQVVAGVKLGSVIWSGVHVNADGSVTVTIPQPQILHVTLTDKTQVANRETGLFTKGDYELETKLRNALMDQVKVEALSGGILETAGDKARSTIRGLLESAGVKVQDVQIQGATSGTWDVPRV